MGIELGEMGLDGFEVQRDEIRSAGLPFLLLVYCQYNEGSLTSQSLQSSGELDMLFRSHDRFDVESGSDTEYSILSHDFFLHNYFTYQIFLLLSKIRKIMLKQSLDYWLLFQLLVCHFA